MENILNNKYALFIFSVVTARYLLCKQNSPDGTEEEIVIDSLWVYPVKSCRGIRVDSAKVVSRGLQYDREFMVVDRANKFVSQRTFPKMALISTQIDYALNRVVLTKQDEPLQSPLFLPLTADYSSAARIKVSIWKDTCDAVDCGEEASQWFNSLFNTEGCRIVRMAPEWVRSTSPDYAPNGQNSFSDGFPFLLASVESLADLNSRLKQPVDMLNFRPNIVVRGIKKPWDEDNWGNIAITSRPNHRFNAHRLDTNATTNSQNTLNMAVVKPCSRCQIPNLDPNTGVESPDKEPNKTLKSFHCGHHMNLKSKKFLGEIMFGQNVDHAGISGSTISVGDVVSVLSSRPAWL